jgi:hypothetical protein
MDRLKKFLNLLFSPSLAVYSLKVALVVGTILLIINHSQAIYFGYMDNGRWVSALVSYVVPYLVSIHGQISSMEKKKMK